MAKPKPSPATLFKFAVATLLCFSTTSILAGNPSSPDPISDMEISERKQACYADIESGLWGTRCRSSSIEKENCALKCTSAVCYELVYESDPLEEGEIDRIRSQEFRYCMRRSSVGLNLDTVKGAFDNEVIVRPSAFALPGTVRVT
ncbi:uncharacterized protein LOC110038547 [Phalaenopsis equestris]|uniref:uncharacterized protein LOC110038547 n=1 Tax=Phalaenopsis equestris TaxID=78828 RepID=UPI0009E24544|nr:uncharacterized protein LOC110038547 [Phalaenopsis equestris]